MNMSAVSMQQNMRSLQSAASTLVLDKAMGMDAQSMAIMLQDMQAANPVASFVSPGGMDIRV